MMIASLDLQPEKAARKPISFCVFRTTKTPNIFPITVPFVQAPIQNYVPNPFRARNAAVIAQLPVNKEDAARIEKDW